MEPAQEKRLCRVCKELRPNCRAKDGGIICQRCDTMLNGKDYIERVHPRPMRAG